MAQDCYDQAEARRSFTRKEQAVLDMSEMLKNEHEENTPETTGVYADLLNAALSEVNWHEIAESLMEDVDVQGGSDDDEADE